MAEKSQDNKKKPMFGDKKLDLSLVGIADNIVFSKKDVWAYFQLTNEVYDFLDNQQKISLALRSSSALNNLVSDRQEALECHLIGTSVPVDIDAWAAQVKTSASEWQQGPGFDRFVAEQISFLKSKEYMRKVAYLGINLGRRGALNTSELNVFEAGFKGVFNTLMEWSTKTLAVPSVTVTAAEEKAMRMKEEEYFRTLSMGHLKAKRVSAEDLLLLIKRQFYPAMPSPYLDIDHGNRIGPGDIALELGSAVENKYRWMKFTQMYEDIEVSTYRAALTFAKFPRETNFPVNGFPFFYFPSKLQAPFTFYSRFILHPHSKMKAQLEKKRLEQKDELKNIAMAQNELDNVVSGMPTDLQQSLDDSARLSHELESEKSPWPEGSYRIVVEASTERDLRDYCNSLKQSYDDLGILLRWTAGDQAEMFLEQMPGDHMRSKSFDQTTNLYNLSTSGFNYSSDVGDPVFGAE